MLRKSFRSVFAGLTCLALSFLASCGGGDSSTAVSSGGSSTTTVDRVRIDPAVRSLAVGETATFKAEALDAAGSVLTGKTFSWSSTSSTVASVGIPIANPVTVTALVNGATQINATTENKTGTASLTVGGQANVQVTGRVIDGQTNAGLGGALVEFVESFGTTTTTTAADGSFSYSYAINSASGGPINAVIGASLSGYAKSTLRTRITAATSTIEPIVLARQGTTTSTISGTVRNARDGTGISGTLVYLETGQGDPTLVNGAANTVTNAAGEYSFSNLAAGTYTVSARPDKFSGCQRTAISVGPPSVANQDVLCSPADILDPQIRIVLSWGRNPSDLDAHLTGPNAGSPVLQSTTDSTRFHIFYPPGAENSEKIAPFARLDIDDVDAFGPETITLTKFNPGGYRFSVHDYSNRSSASSNELGRSAAKVELYTGLGSTLQTFFVPNQPGTVWTVFELSGDFMNPTVTTRNTMGFTVKPEDLR
jgi:uncharacterized protein YfaP (DUF2135 family)